MLGHPFCWDDKMAATDEKSVLEALMLKRSQSATRLKSVSYKPRWFVLTKASLRYHDGNSDASSFSCRVIISHRLT
ncbi:hypothetical protein HPB47_026712 [Ixodes persulcatus]|uniref:Uncharacterized protein n=1 Tax=Ixodes persulcatus TaxID=34615 RepID=A0AC60PYF8_IXOPE|nr:hypothetical protein HPB47_026712 [Ixodes persulcatus]